MVSEVRSGGETHCVSKLPCMLIRVPLLSLGAEDRKHQLWLENKHEDWEGVSLTGKDPRGGGIQGGGLEEKQT